MPMTESRTDLLAGLLVTDLPAGPTAALEVLWMADDPDVGAAELGRVVRGDPGLTQRLMRLANSAYYGLSGRVADPTFAISVIGFDTLRAIAASTAAGIDGSQLLPEGHLEASVTTAVAASLVAPRLGVRPPEAHSLGLLHNIGAWMLHRSDPEAYATVRREAAAGDVPLHLLEVGRFGAHSGEVGAALLDSWRFPPDFAQAMATAHEGADHPRTPLAGALHTGRALAALAQRPPDAAQPADLHPALRTVLEWDEVGGFTARVRADAERLEAALRC